MRLALGIENVGQRESRNLISRVEGSIHVKDAGLEYYLSEAYFFYSRSYEERKKMGDARCDSDMCKDGMVLLIVEEGEMSKFGTDPIITPLCRAESPSNQ
jgi:hypothetical protein